MWSFEAQTGPSGWSVRAQTFESCAWENVARAGGFAGRKPRARPCLRMPRMMPLRWKRLRMEDEAGVGVPAVGEERSQWMFAPFRAARDQDWVHGAGSGSGSSASSSDASVSSASLALGCGHAQLRPCHVAVQCRAHSGPCGHNRGRPLSRVPSSWATRRTWMGVRAH
jgi:hypothetical protein